MKSRRVHTVKRKNNWGEDTANPCKNERLRNRDRARKKDLEMEYQERAAGPRILFLSLLNFEHSRSPDKRQHQMMPYHCHNLLWRHQKCFFFTDADQTRFSSDGRKGFAISLFWLRQVAGALVYTSWLLGVWEAPSTPDAWSPLESQFFADDRKVVFKTLTCYQLLSLLMR